MVKDTTGIALSKATVNILSNTNNATTLTDDNGQFKFRIPRKQQFQLEISMKGYISYKCLVNPSPTDTTIQLGEVTLSYQFHVMDPAIVTRVRPITVGKDTITYSADAFPVRNGSELQDILKRLPGVLVDLNGNVIVQGKVVSTLMVNGKLFFGGNVLTAIQNLPADVIDKIQVIDDYGDKARLTGVRSGQSSKILNIELKKDKRNGVFGQVQAGIGNLGKYTSESSANLFSKEKQMAADVGANENGLVAKDIQKKVSSTYSDRWGPRWKIESTAAHSNNKIYSSSSTIQDSHYDNLSTHLEQTSQDTGRSSADNLSMVLTYTPDAFNTLRISPSLSFQRSIQASNVGFSNTQRDSVGLKRTDGLSKDQQSGKGSVGFTQIYFEHISAQSKKRYNATIITQFSENDQVTNSNSDASVMQNGQKNNSLQDYHIKASTPSMNLSALFNYFLPVGTTGFIESGYTWQAVVNKSIRQTYGQGTTNNPLLIDSLSQSYYYSNSFHKIHTGYNARWGKLNLTSIIDLQVGQLSGNTSLRNAKVSYKYTNPLPTIQAAYMLTNRNTVSFDYNGRAILPDLQQIQPGKDVSNPQYPIMGNPSLRSSYINSLSFSYEYSNIKANRFFGFGIIAGYNIIKHPIVANIIHPKDSSSVIQLTTYDNSGSGHVYFSNYHITFPDLWKNKLRITLSGEFTANYLTAISDNTPYSIINLVNSHNLQCQIVLKDILESELYGTYTTANSLYLINNENNSTTSTIKWGFSNRHYGWHDWLFSYQFSEILTRSSMSALKSNPPTIMARIERQFLKKRNASISLSGYNLLSSSNLMSQSVTSTSITATQTNLPGRYFLISFLLKLKKFN